MSQGKIQGERLPPIEGLRRARSFLRSTAALVTAAFLALTLVNQGIPTAAQVTVSLPAGVQVIDPGQGQIQNGTLVFDVTLAAGGQKTLSFWVRLPSLPGTVNLSATGRVVATASLALEVLQPEELGSIKARIDALIQARHPEKKVLEQASRFLDKALNNFYPAKAVEEALKAADALLGLIDPAIVEIRIALGHWLKLASQYVR